MSYENLVGLQVIDENGYAQYRDAMTPILKKFGGGFRYDFRISEVLKKETSNEMNRVFVISFPDKASKEAFFADPGYKEVRAKYLENSITARTVIAEYTT
jgi:uncharacterized protein (DUF1330 family)